MHNFTRQNGELYCEKLPLAELARRFGTPLYVYSHETLMRHYRVFDEAFAGFPHLICFSVKANSNQAILQLLASAGSGADIVSGGELFRALRAGMDPKRIVYSGVGKTIEEMEQALDSGILMFNLESFQELELLDQVAGKRGVHAPISLRINPDVNPQTHPYVATGLKTSKFGISFNDAIAIYRQAGQLNNIDVIGVDCHIGSQLTQIAPFVEAVAKLRELIHFLRDDGFDIQHLDLGGGLGITYDAEEPPLPADYGQAIKNELAGESISLILEPGRNIVGNAGLLLARVLYTKQQNDKYFVVTDTGMNDLIRPSLYDSFHAVVPVTQSEQRPKVVADVVGPICETGDFLARDREIPRCEPNELLAVMSAGAYGFTMASTYNSRPLAAEVIVKGDQAILIRKRGTYQDLIRGEALAEFDPS